MRRAVWVFLAATATGPAAVAQDAIPAVPGVPAAAAAPTSMASAAAPTKNLWSMLLPSQQQCDKVKQKCCNSAIGKMLNGMLTPLSAFSGGVLGPSCPPVNPADLAQPADSAAGAASRTAADQAGAAERIKNVQYLSTADCRYYPEAEAALINSLRADKVECVRIAAAKAFLTGCCCTKKVIAALMRSVNGDDKDGNPGERSECVKAFAFLALQRCLANYSEPAAPPEPGEKAPAEKEKKADASDAPVLLAAYYRQLGPTPVVVAEARAIAARGLNVSKEALRQMGGGPKTVAAIVVGTPQAALTPAKPAEPPAVPPAGYREFVVPLSVPASPPPPKQKGLLRLWEQAWARGE